jgi:hypothetical protein
MPLATGPCALADDEPRHDRGMKITALALACAACGSSPAAPDAGAIDAKPAPDGRLDTYNGAITDTNSKPIAGAMICVLDHPDIPCATTDGSGAYQIHAPDLQGAQIAVEATATGYLGEVSLQTEPVDANGFHITEWPSKIFLPTTAMASAQLGTQAGFTFPGTGTGFLLMSVHGATAGVSVGATVAISPTAGKGPVYWDTNGPNPSLGATTSDSGVSFGDLPPGRYSITATAPQRTCTVTRQNTLISGDWAPTGSETTDVEITAGAETLGVSVVCL